MTEPEKSKNSSAFTLFAVAMLVSPLLCCVVPGFLANAGRVMSTLGSELSDLTRPPEPPPPPVITVGEWDALDRDTRRRVCKKASPVADDCIDCMVQARKLDDWQSLDFADQLAVCAEDREAAAKALFMRKDNNSWSVRSSSTPTPASRGLFGDTVGEWSSQNVTTRRAWCRDAARAIGYNQYSCMTCLRELATSPKGREWDFDDAVLACKKAQGL